MEKVIRIISKDQEEEESLDFWASKSPEERLDALQVMREQYRRLFHKERSYRESRKGLRRICRVTQRT